MLSKCSTGPYFSPGSMKKIHNDMCETSRKSEHRLVLNIRELLSILLALVTAW